MDVVGVVTPLVGGVARDFLRLSNSGYSSKCKRCEEKKKKKGKDRWK